MGKDLVSIADLSQEQLTGLLRHAVDLKSAWHRRQLEPLLAGQVLALVFQKPSLRTRVSFEVAMQHLGGHCMYLSPQEVQLGEREGVADAARVLSRYVQGIVVRTYFHDDVMELAQHASVPVINGLSDLEHPCQVLADLLTVFEHRPAESNPVVAWVGDGNNVAHSLMLAAPRAGVGLRLATPVDYEPEPEIVQQAMAEAEERGTEMWLSHDPFEVVRRADFIYTDVWYSMGEEDEREVRQEVFRPYQVNSRLLSAAGPQARVLHCLPAHRGDEITDEVLDGPATLVFDQAENRLHVQKALLCLLMRDRGAPEGPARGSDTC